MHKIPTSGLQTIHFYGDLQYGSFELLHPTGDGKEKQITPEQLQFILQGVVL
jgi:hypothetical protein